MDTTKKRALATEYRDLAEFSSMRGALALAVHCDDVADKLEHEVFEEVGTCGACQEKPYGHDDFACVPVDPASLNDCEACQ